MALRLQNISLRSADLEAQLQYLQENGYETIFFEDLSHLEQYEKPVILTFDDGYDDNYTVLYPLLEKYQTKATPHSSPSRCAASASGIYSRP